MNPWLAGALWSMAIWFIIFVLRPTVRWEMLRVSLWTMPFGLTEPLFVPEYWNPPSLFNLAARTGFDIESLIFCFSFGGVAAVLCRRDLAKKVLVGGLLFLCLYFAFFLLFNARHPGFVQQVWNLGAISGILVLGVPLEELLFAFTFGTLWAGLYEHLLWYWIGKKGQEG